MKLPNLDSDILNGSPEKNYHQVLPIGNGFTAFLNPVFYPVAFLKEFR